MPTTHSNRDLLLGAVLALLAAISTWWVMGQATLVLILGMALAFAVWIAHGPLAPRRHASLFWVYCAGLVVMAAHCYEEYLAEFYVHFPALVGQEWSAARWVGFNTAWMAIFALAAFGIWWRVEVAYLVVWFFALTAGVVNGIGHLLLCLWQLRCFREARPADADSRSF